MYSNNTGLRQLVPARSEDVRCFSRLTPNRGDLGQKTLETERAQFCGTRSRGCTEVGPSPIRSGFTKRAGCNRDLHSAFWLTNLSNMPKVSIRDLDLKGKTVFIRVDFNVPLAPGGQEISSDKRVRASLPTIQYALDHGAGVILASHLGRPKGKPNMEMSLKPVAVRLAQLLGRPVKMAPDCVGSEVEKMRPAPGEVLLLENLRFHAEEEKNDPAFSKQLAALCDVYVNDAFGSAHRARSSTVGMIAFV